MTDTTGAGRTPTSNPVLKRALVWGGLLAAVILVVAGVLGLVFAGVVGLVSAIVGTVMAVVFMAITAASILLANRFAGSDVFVGAFFGIVLGGWLLKFVLFIVLVVVLRDAPWLNTTVLFLSIVAGVIASLVVDVLVVAKSRLPYASDATLPPAPSDDRPPSAP
jgi:drug/metabolite transporter (DMT)-like permease